MDEKQQRFENLVHRVFKRAIICIITILSSLGLGLLKACSHGPILRIRFLVLKIGSRRSDGPISRFRFRGENVKKSFVVCSHGPIFRTNKECSIWRQNDRRLLTFKKSVK